MNLEPFDEKKRIKQEMLLEYEAETMKMKKIFVVIMAILSLILAGVGLWVYKNDQTVRTPAPEMRN